MPEKLKPCPFCGGEAEAHVEDWNAAFYYWQVVCLQCEVKTNPNQSSEQAAIDNWNRRADDVVLRRLLWLRHGCPMSTLYGDDGEMQCSKCGIDFKRMSAGAIEDAFVKIGRGLLVEQPLPEPPEGEE